MKTETVVVAVDNGMEPREIALFVQMASRFDSILHLTDGQRRMNAKSIMGMMALGLALGDSVTVEADGTDEDEALQAVTSFLKGKTNGSV